MSKDVAAYLTARIQKKGKLPAGTEPAAFDYIESGHVDSVGIIQFILDIEREFDIVIGEADIDSADFRTIGGLTALIERKVRRP
jgi:acyl carrier protein